MARLLVVLSLLTALAVCSQPIFVRKAAQSGPASDICNKTTCASVGQSCGTSVQCVDNSYCSSNYTCVNYIPVGANCTIGFECQYAVCAGGKCVAQNYQSIPPGEKCSASSDCAPVAGVANAGECVTGRCYGLLIGQQCTTHGVPGACINSYCSNKTSVCTAYYLSGQICDAQDLCANPLTCTNGVCHYPNVSAQGGPCATTDDCEVQLFCGSNKTCLPEASITRAACNMSTPCSEGTCTCNAEEGKLQCWTPLSPGVLSNEIALQKCLEQNNCTTKNYTNDCIDAGVCVTETCAYWTSMQTRLQLFDPVRAQCLNSFTNSQTNKYSPYISQYCPVNPDDNGGFPTWAIVLIVIAGIVVLAALGYFVYVKTSKRDQYSAIEHR